MTTIDPRPAPRISRRDATVIAVAAVASLLLSPITVVWAVALGVPAALLGWALERWAPSAASRTPLLVAVGVVLGALPYLIVAAVIAAT